MHLEIVYPKHLVEVARDVMLIGDLFDLKLFTGTQEECEDFIQKFQYQMKIFLKDEKIELLEKIKYKQFEPGRNGRRPISELREEISKEIQRLKRN